MDGVEPVQQLSDELLLHIFQWLDLRSLCTSALACRAWWRVSADDSLWRPYWTSTPFHMWWQPFATSFNPAAGSLRQQYAVCARASRQLLHKQATSSAGRVALRAMIVGSDDVGKDSLSYALQRTFRGVCHHVCHKKHPAHDEELDSRSGWWNERANDEWTIVGPSLGFGDALVHVTTEVAALSPPCHADESGTAAKGEAQETRIVRMAECAEVSPDVVLVVMSVGHASTILAVLRQIVPAIRREYNHLPILLVATQIDRRTATGLFAHDQAMTLSRRIGAANYVEVSPITGVGLGALLHEIIHLAIGSSMMQALQSDKGAEGAVPVFPDMPVHRVLNVVPSIHYGISCFRCLAMPIVGQAWVCKTCGEAEHELMCSACKLDHARRKVDHRVVPCSAARSRRRDVKVKATVMPTPASDDDRDHGAGSLAEMGFCHRNSRFFQKRRRVDHPHQDTPGHGDDEDEDEVEMDDSKHKTSSSAVRVAGRWQAGVDDIFQLFSKK